MKDFKLVAPWAKYDIGSVSIPYASIKDLTQDQYQVLIENGRYDYKNGDKDFVKTHH